MLTKDQEKNNRISVLTNFVITRASNDDIEEIIKRLQDHVGYMNYLKDEADKQQSLDNLNYN